jgi:thiamine pyrophosphokinase
MKSVYLVSYCTSRDIEFLKNEPEEDRIVVGVDQGCSVLLDQGITPNYFIGDFDSFNIETITNNNNHKIIILEKEKNYSDLEFAVKHFIGDNNKIVIINNLQGRFDHIISSVFLLEMCKNIYIKNFNSEIYLTEKFFTGSFPPGTLISLVPISPIVKGITTEGLYFQLQNETLKRESTRGISNKIIDKYFNVSFLDGKLLIIITLNV